MRTSVKGLVQIMAVLVIGLGLSACGTTERSFDASTQFSSSTTPGTSFTNDGMVKADQKVRLFATVNRENLEENIARGEGEYLASLGELVGIAPEQENMFFSRVQQHSQLLIGSERTQPDEMLTRLHTVLLQDPSLPLSR